MSKKSLAQVFRRWIARGNRVPAARPAAKLRLEEVEQRVVPATTPPVTSAAAIAVPNTTGGYAPQVVADPTNPNTLAMVTVADSGVLVNGAPTSGIVAQISFDGGLSWTKLRDNSRAWNPDPNVSNVPSTFSNDASRGKLLDPNRPSGLPNNFIPEFQRGYTNASAPTIAFTRSGSVYIGYLQHNADMTSGALVVERFDIDRAAETFVQYDLDPARDWDNDPSTPATERWRTASLDFVDAGANRAAVLYQWVDDGTTVNRPANVYMAVDVNLPTYTDPDVTTDTATDPFAAFTQTTQIPDGANPAEYEVATTTGGDTVFVAWNMIATAPVILGSQGFSATNLGYTSSAVMLAVGRLDPQALFDRANPNAPVSASNPRRASFQFSTPVPVNDGYGSGSGLASGGHFLGGPVDTTAPFNTGGAAPIISFTPPALRDDPLNSGQRVVTPGQMTITWSTPGNFIAQSTVALGAGPASSSYTFRSNDNPEPSAGGFTPFFPPFFSDGSPPPQTFIADADPATGSDIPNTTAYDIPVDLSAFGPNGFTSLEDLDVTLAISHPNLNHLLIQLVAPDGTTVTLVRNKIQGNGQNVPNGTFGIAGNDLGVAQGNTGNFNRPDLFNPGNVAGTTFSDEAARQINDTQDLASGTHYIASYRPEAGSLATFYGRSAAQLNSLAGVNWQLRITDVRHDNIRINNVRVEPIQYLRYWSLTFTSRLDNTNDFPNGRLGADRFVTAPNFGSLPAIPAGDASVVNRATTVGFSDAQTYPTAALVSPTFGVGPGVSVAYDNSLGSFSRFAGRMYAVYTGTNTGETGPNAPNVDTNIYLLASDDNGASWFRPMGTTVGANGAINIPVPVNDDSRFDNFSEGRRSQFQPTVTVDAATGTVVVMWFDARTDASNARVATYVATSTDGGVTFSAARPVNPEKISIDAITGNKVVLEPIPTNLAGPTTYNAGDTVNTNPGTTTNVQYGGVGIRQAVVAFGGVIKPFWAGNLNAPGSSIFTSTVRTAAGPRVLESDMGAVSEDSVDPAVDLAPQNGAIPIRDEDGFPTTIIDAFGQPRFQYNNTFAPDGTRQIDGFRIVFDRPVYFGPNATTPDGSGEGFGAEDVDVRFRGPTGVVDTATQGAKIPLAGVRPIGGYTDSGSYFATAFFVQFATPQSAVGTYSYAVSPTLSDRVRSTNTAVFTAADTPLQLEDPGLVESEIVIPPLPGNPTVQDLQIGLNLSHTFLSDLRVSLVAPDGTEILLFQGQGGTQDDIINMRLADNGSFPPYPSTAPFNNFNGVFRPFVPLATLAGKSIAGTWRLRIADLPDINGLGNNQTGILNAWTLKFRDAAGNPVLIPRDGVGANQGGNGLDQDADGLQQEADNDTYTAPRSVNGTPFTGPFDTTTRPLILPGPHVVRTYAGGQQPTAVSAAVNPANSNQLLVTLDREVDANTLTLAGIASVTGPNGSVTPTGVIPTNVVDGGTKTFTLVFANPLPAGAYSVTLNNRVFVTDDLVLNQTAGEMFVRFDRDINPATFTAANVLRITGPLGVLTSPGVTVTAVGDDRAPLAAGATAARLFRVTFTPQAQSGPYLVEFGSNPAEPNDFLAAIRGADRPQLAGVATQTAGVTKIDVPLSAVPTGGALTSADIVRIIGPNGPINPLLVVVGPPAAPAAGDPPGTVQHYTLTLPAGSPAGQYVIDFNPSTGAGGRNIRVAGSGLPVDSDLDAGLDLATGRAAPGSVVAVRVFASTSLPVPITPATTDGNGTPETSDDRVVPTVAEMPLVIADDFTITQDQLSRIQVLLNINYPRVGDLQVELVPPTASGVAPILLYNGPDADAGAQNGANFTNTVLVDRLGDPNFPSILNSQPPFTPAAGFGFTPQNPLSVLADPNKPVSARGTWVLRVTNRGTSAGSTGQIVNWQLTLPRAEPGTGLGERVADRFQAGFRVFTQDPNMATSHDTWTPVGPASANEGANSGRVTAVVVDPSDPSGNTVYVAGASGGVWKTTNFLTPDVDGPHYVPLTDFGPTAAINVQSLALFPRNNDPNQTIVFALTGEGNTLVSANTTNSTRTQLTSTGVGLLRSTDGGKTWTVLDSTDNESTDPNATPGTVGKVSDPGRNRTFFGASGFKVVVDPNPTPEGGVIVYMALRGSAAQAGVWRSRDGGLTWERIRAGQATDLVLAAGSANTVDPNTGQTVANGNLQRLYAAFAGEGVFVTDSAPSTNGMTLMAGGGGLPSTADLTAGGAPVAVQNNPSPSGAGSSRIVLAAPALTNDPVRNSFYKDWLYAVVINGAGTITGLYQTKDRGLNWTLVQLPIFSRITASDGSPVDAYPTNDESRVDYDVTAFGNLGDGNFDIALSVDPQNPAVLYMAGLGEKANRFLNSGPNALGEVDLIDPIGGSIRIDLTKVKDTQNFTFFNDSDPDRDGNPLGDFATATVGGAAVRNPAQGTRGRVVRGGTLINYPTDFLNLSKDPVNPFASNSTLRVRNIGSVVNDGSDVFWQPFADVLGVGALRQGRPNDTNPNTVENEREAAGFVHGIFPLVDPVSGQTRFIYSTDQGVFTGVNAGETVGYGTLATALGFDRQVAGSRNGNLQLTQFYSGAVQPSQLAADIAGALFYGMADSNGFLASDPRELANGNTNWRGPEGDGAWVEVDQTGTGTSYQYRAPNNDGIDSNFTALAKDFFRVFLPGSDPQFSGGLGRTFGLIQAGDDPYTGSIPANASGQWPAAPHLFGFNFAVNPVNPNVLVIASSTGQVFRSTDRGVNWVSIGVPENALPGQQAFGATDPNNPSLTNNFIYVGTQTGRVYVTTTGGATWTSIAPGSLDGSAIRRVIPNPAAGSRELYVVTNNGVYYKVDGTDTTTPWTNITGNLFSVTRAAYRDAQDQVTALPSSGLALTSMVVDWRFAYRGLGAGQPVPVNVTATPTTAPDLYVAGVGGVFKSDDFGVTWRLFPDLTPSVANAADGGNLPAVAVTDLDLSIGNINQTSGRYQAGGLNLLLATTYGRGSWAIRLSDQLPANTAIPGPSVTSVINPNPAGGPSNALQVQFSGPVDPATIKPENFQLQPLDASGNPVGSPVPILSVTPVSGTGIQNRYQITFQTQTVASAQYRLTVGFNPNGSGVPTITDPSGTRMNQDGDATNGEAIQDQYISVLTLNGFANSLTVQPYNQRLTAGVASDLIRVEVRRADGTVDTTATGPLTITGNGPGTIQLLNANGQPTTTVMLANGVATFRVLATSGGSYTVNVTDGPNVNPTAFTLDVTGAPAVSVTLTPSSPTTTAGQAVTYTLTFTDQFGNPTGYADTVTISYSGAPVAPGSPTSVTVNTANGQSTFAVTTQQTGTVTVSVSAPRPAGAPGTGPLTASASVTVNPAAGNQFVVTPAGPFTAGSPGTVTVRLVDANGNLVTSANGPVTVTAPGATSPPATVNLTNGAGSISLRYDAPGSYTVTVSNGSATGSAGVTVNAQPPRQTPTEGLSGIFAAATGVDGSPIVTVFQPNGQVLTTLNPFPPGFGGEVDAGSAGFTGGIRVSVADVTGDGVADYVVGSGPTITATVQVISGATNRTVLTLRPFETFKGGVFVSTGDVDKDGLADIVITPDQGGGPRVTIFKGGSFRQIANFFGIDDPNFRGGARAALGDVNGDGNADLVVSAGFGGGPRISIYDGAALAQGQRLNVIGDFFLFEPALRNGAYVAVGDVNGDGLADIIGGAGPGGGPRVLILDSATLLAQGAQAALAAPLFNSFLGDVENRGGVRVAAKNLNNDRFADILIGAGEGGGSRVEAYSGGDFGLLLSFDLLPGYTGGVFVG